MDRVLKKVRASRGVAASVTTDAASAVPTTVTNAALVLLLASALGTPLALAGETGSGETTRPPPEGGAGSAPAPAPEIKPIGGGTITLEPINAPPVTREDAPGNKPATKFVYDPACDDPFVYC